MPRQNDPTPETLAEPAEEEVSVGKFRLRVFALIGCLFALWVVQDSWDALGTLARPGAGMWPASVAVVLAVFCGVLVVRNPTSEEFALRPLAKPALLVAALTMFIVAYDVIGFLVPGTLLMFLHLKAIGRESWLTSIVVAGVTTAASYVLFSILLGANLRPF